MRRVLISFIGCVLTGAVCAAPSIRNLGAAKSTGSVARASAAPAARAASDTIISAKNSKPNIKSVRAATRTATAPRLSVGRLHTNAGKSISTTPEPSGGPDLSDYAKIHDMEHADDAIARRIDDIQTQIDNLNLDGFPTADGDGLYLVQVSNGVINLTPTSIATGPYTGP